VETRAKQYGRAFGLKFMLTTSKILKFHIGRQLRFDSNELKAGFKFSDFRSTYLYPFIGL
jgi:hypothetical protein